MPSISTKKYQTEIKNKRTAPKDKKTKGLKIENFNLKIRFFQRDETKIDEIVRSISTETNQHQTMTENKIGNRELKNQIFAR